MRLIYLLLLVITNAITAFSTTVITDPYSDLDYEEIAVYRLNEDGEIEEDNPCDSAEYSWTIYGK